MLSTAEVAENIKKTAKLKGFVLKEVLESCSLNKNFLSDMRKGAKPSIDAISSIANKLGVTTSYLLGEIDNPDIEVKKIPSERGDRTLILSRGGENVEIDPDELSALIEQAKRETEPQPMPATADELRQLIQDEIKRVMGKGE